MYYFMKKTFLYKLFIYVYYFIKHLQLMKNILKYVRI